MNWWDRFFVKTRRVQKISADRSALIFDALSADALRGTVKRVDDWHALFCIQERDCHPQTQIQ